MPYGGEGRAGFRGQSGGVAQVVYSPLVVLNSGWACAVDWLILSHMLLFSKSGCTE